MQILKIILHKKKLFTGTLVLSYEKVRGSRIMEALVRTPAYAVCTRYKSLV